MSADGSVVERVRQRLVLTHLAIYSGWPNAVTALAVFDRVYTDMLPESLRARLPQMDAPRYSARNAAETLIAATLLDGK